MTIEATTSRTKSTRPPRSPRALDLRCFQLASDYARLAVLPGTGALRDVGALLLLGHDHALAEAERYVGEGHTARTGDIVECDDIDDLRALDRWSRILDRASDEGHAPPVPVGFWGSFLRWRTPLGMIRSMSSSRLRIT